MKIVLNKDYGGFSLSELAKNILKELSPRDTSLYSYEEYRDNDNLVEVVERLGEHACGKWASLEIVEIPDETTDWIINEYDGYETLYYVVYGKIHTI